MNRTLKRPMFRMGGSAGTGITSGLDTPKRGIVDGPGKYSQPATDAELVQRSLARTKEVLPILEQLQGTRSPFSASGVPGFLTSFGLDLLSRPPSGNIFQTAALAAKGPFENLQATQMMNRRRKGEQAADIFSNILSSEYSLEEEKQKQAGETSTQFERVERAKLSNQFYDDKIKQKEDDLLNAGPQERANVQEEINALIRKKDDQYNSIISGKMSDDEFVKDIIIAGVKSDIFDPAKVAKLYPELADLLYDDAESNADGGRVGRQMGGPAMMPDLAKTDEDQVEDLSYNELRARLPQSIDNDVVQVIANSKQALLDFANIRDQQDVDEFNQRYNVSLNIAQEG